MLRWKTVSLAVLLAAGCVQNEYTIELTPVGEKLQRQIHIKRQGPDATPAELQHLASEYAADFPTTPKVQEFQHAFAGRLPDDIGGHGNYIHWQTRLGSVSLYVERFRGNDDPAAEWERRKVAADRLTDHLTAWLAREFQDDPAWPTLREFLDNDFRRDLLNLGLYLWTASLQRFDERNPEAFVRIIQYLVERDYLSYEEAPVLMRSIIDGHHDEGRHVMEIVRNKLVSRARDDFFTDSLEFLETPESLMNSLTQYLETTNEFRQVLAAWEKTLRTDPTTSRPEPVEVLSPDLICLLAGLVPMNGDQFQVGLTTSREPLVTNGDWSAKDQRVSWPKHFLPAHGQPPLLSYAGWDQPDVAVQEAHFGKVVLQGKSLVTYCLWYHGLTEAEQQEWNAFVQTLTPGEELPGKLDAFQFQHEPAGRTGTSSLAGAAISEILDGLRAKAAD